MQRCEQRLLLWAAFAAALRSSIAQRHCPLGPGALVAAGSSPACLGQWLGKQKAGPTTAAGLAGLA